MKPLIILLTLCAYATSAAAQSFETQDIRDWTVVRGGDGAGCFATVSVGLKAPSSGLATLSLFPRRAEAGAPAVLSVQVPLGASLPDGIAYTYRSGSEAVGLAWQYCTERTCVASGGVSAAELDRLKRGRRIFLGFVPLPGSAAVITPVSLLGITKAWAEVQACS